jgi:soluble lytic murein transglycosylase-like protein
MPNPRRLSRAAVGSTLLLVLLVPSSVSIPSPLQHQPPAPSAPELALLEELAEWVHGDASRYRLFEGGETLGDLVRTRRRSFELFRDFNAREQRYRVVSALPYGSLIQQAADQYRLDSFLLAAVVEAESGFNPRAVSPRGARGLMQLMPETAAHYGANEVSDPAANVRAGARYLRELLEQYDHDLELALAAYNAGPGNVARYRGVPPFRETRRYVARVLGSYVALHRELWHETEAVELLGSDGATFLAAR